MAKLREVEQVALRRGRTAGFQSMSFGMFYHADGNQTNCLGIPGMRTSDEDMKCFFAEIELRFSASFCYQMYDS